MLLVYPEARSLTPPRAPPASDASVPPPLPSPRRDVPRHDGVRVGPLRRPPTLVLAREERAAIVVIFVVRVGVLSIRRAASRAREDVNASRRGASQLRLPRGDLVRLRRRAVRDRARRPSRHVQHDVRRGGPSARVERGEVPRAPAGETASRATDPVRASRRLRFLEDVFSRSRAFTVAVLRARRAVRAVADRRARFDTNRNKQIGGGKERMTHYFEQEKDNAEPFKTKYPFHDDARKEYIKSLHARKTELFLEIVTAGKLPLRPGVKRLIQVGWYFFQTALPTTHAFTPRASNVVSRGFCFHPPSRPPPRRTNFRPRSRCSTLTDEERDFGFTGGVR